MPEGPEVANIATQLNKILSGYYIDDIQILSGRYSKHGPPALYEEFINCFPLQLKEVEFKGKLIVFHFENKYGDKWWVFNTLGMSGGWTLDKGKHSHILLNFFNLQNDEKIPIYFKDQRCFGTIKFCNDIKEYQSKLKSIANGFLGKYQIDLEEFKKAISKHSHKNYTKCIMDQKSICSGVGNYLLSEVCYQTGINPWGNFEELKESQIENLYTIIKNTIEASYKAGGATIMNYSDIQGEEGEYTYDFLVYGKDEDPEGNKIIKKEGPHGRTIHVSEKYLQRKSNTGTTNYSFWTE